MAIAKYVVISNGCDEMWLQLLLENDEMWSQPDGGVEAFTDRSAHKLVVKSGSHPGEEAEVEKTRVVTWNLFLKILREEKGLVFLPGVFGPGEEPAVLVGNRVWQSDM